MVVTRFAPSPTGYLHIGGARTALFCYLMARHHQGKFILRIEDTDCKRNTPTATQQVMDDLRWLGIEWDQGPDIGGPNGPYLQSERLEIYNRYLEQLLQSGQAYHCFDTPEEIDVFRQQAQAEKKTFLYPRPDRFPDEQEVKKARQQGRPVVVRFAIPDQETITVEDIIRGQVQFNTREISDTIIQKSDGFPTYHFACVVDDELMKVTHVIRGQEHLMNTPVHMLLQQALGFSTPTYAHMSVTVSESGGKLSKRDRAKTLIKALKEQIELDLPGLCKIGGLSEEEFQSFLQGQSSPDAPVITRLAEHLGIVLPEINVVDFCKSGYLPEALMNFVALLGWSTGSQEEIMTQQELIDAFDIQRLNKSNSLFDRKKLISFNTEHFRKVPMEKLIGYFRHYLKLNDSPILAADDATLQQLLIINEGAQTLAQIEGKSLFLFQEKIQYDPKSVKKVLQKPGVDEILSQVRRRFSDLANWDKAALHGVIEQICAEKQLGMGKVAQPIRVAITGTMISPPIDASLLLLGKEKTLQRIDHTIELLKTLES